MILGRGAQKKFEFNSRPFGRDEIDDAGAILFRFSKEFKSVPIIKASNWPAETQSQRNIQWRRKQNNKNNKRERWAGKVSNREDRSEVDGVRESETKPSASSLFVCVCVWLGWCVSVTVLASISQRESTKEANKNKKTQRIIRRIYIIYGRYTCRSL